MFRIQFTEEGFDLCGGEPGTHAPSLPMCGGHRTTSGAGLHLPPYLRQGPLILAALHARLVGPQAFAHLDCRLVLPHPALCKFCSSKLTTLKHQVFLPTEPSPQPLAQQMVTKTLGLGRWLSGSSTHLAITRTRVWMPSIHIKYLTGQACLPRARETQTEAVWGSMVSCLAQSVNSKLS